MFVKFLYVMALVATFKLVCAGDDAAKADRQGYQVSENSQISEKDMWVDGKLIRRGDNVSGVKKSEEFMAQMLGQRQENAAQSDLQKQRDDLSYGGQIIRNCSVFWGLLTCKTEQLPRQDDRSGIHTQPTAMPPVPTFFSCKDDPLCILNCCCCCLKVVGCCTWPCRSK